MTHVDAPRHAPAGWRARRATRAAAGSARGRSAPTALATAIIPARGGSKGLPGKNLARVGGVPLVARAVRAALAAEPDRRVVVTTDDDAIAEAARAAGAGSSRRPAELAGATASSESALLHALDDASDSTPCRRPARRHGVRPGHVAVHRPRRPRRGVRAGRGGRARRRVLGRADATSSCGATTPSPAPAGVNHDAARRPRRQDREPEYAETGAFYVMRTDGFRRGRATASSGASASLPVHPDHAIEIDDAADLDAGARDSRRTVDRALAAARRARHRRRPAASARRRRRARHRLRRRAHRRHRHGRPARAARPCA